MQFHCRISRHVRSTSQQHLCAPESERKYPKSLVAAREVRGTSPWMGGAQVCHHTRDGPATWLGGNGAERRTSVARASRGSPLPFPCCVRWLQPRLGLPPLLRPRIGHNRGPTRRPTDGVATIDPDERVTRRDRESAGSHHTQRLARPGRTRRTGSGRPHMPPSKIWPSHRRSRKIPLLEERCRRTCRLDIVRDSWPRALIVRVHSLLDTADSGSHRHPPRFGPKPSQR